MNRFITRVFLFFLCRSGFFSSLYSFLHWLTLFGGFNLLLNRSRFLRPFNCPLLRLQDSLFFYFFLSWPGFFRFLYSFLWRLDFSRSLNRPFWCLNFPG